MLIDERAADPGQEFASEFPASAKRNGGAERNAGPDLATNWPSRSSVISRAFTRPGFRGHAGVGPANALGVLSATVASAPAGRAGSTETSAGAPAQNPDQRGSIATAAALETRSRRQPGRAQLFRWRWRAFWLHDPELAATKSRTALAGRLSRRPRSKPIATPPEESRVLGCPRTSRRFGRSANTAGQPSRGGPAPPPSPPRGGPPNFGELRLRPLQG